MRYFGFNDAADISKQFSDYNAKVPPELVKDSEVLFASYNTPPYEGYAFVLFERDGKLYEVNGSHCSCYGLEDQWQPEETSWAALKIRKFTAYLFEDDETLKALTELIASK
jgi:hypothetical protein